MQTKALLVIDIQNDSAPNTLDIINQVNITIAWAARNQYHILYIRHVNRIPFAKSFKPKTIGVDFLPELNIISPMIFTKYRSNALSCKAFLDYISTHQIKEFIVTGFDASICIKATCTQLRKKNFDVTVIADCITSQHKNKIEPMFKYFTNIGCHIKTSHDLT